MDLTFRVALAQAPPDTAGFLLSSLLLQGDASKVSKLLCFPDQLSPVASHPPREEVLLLV